MAGRRAQLNSYLAFFDPFASAWWPSTLVAFIAVLLLFGLVGQVADSVPESKDREIKLAVYLLLYLFLYLLYVIALGKYSGPSAD